VHLVRIEVDLRWAKAKHEAIDEISWNTPKKKSDSILSLYQYIDIICGARSQWNENLSWIIS